MGERQIQRGRAGAYALWALSCVVASGAVSCGPATSAAGRAAQDDAPRPDVIIVAIDGLAWDQFGAFGESLGETPAFDRLLGDGVAYTRAYATSPWAGETLTSVLSGDLPTAIPAGAGAAALDAEGPAAPGLAEYLRHLGYRTAFAPSHPLHEPAAWQVERRPGRSSAPVPPPGFDERLVIEGQEDLTGAAASDVAVAAVRWLRQEPGPSLLVCTLADPRPPHHLFPGTVPAADLPYEGPVRSGLSHAELLRRAPEFGPDDRARLAELHASEVSVAELAFDHIAGAAITRRRTAPIVVLVGIRRPALGEDGRYGLLPSLAPKDLEVPLVIRFPAELDGTPGPSGRTGAAVSLADVTPTLLDALGLEPRLDIDGRSVFPGAKAPARPIAARTARARGGATLIDGDRAASAEGGGDTRPVTLHRQDPELGWVEVPDEQEDWTHIVTRLQDLLPQGSPGPR